MKAIEILSTLRDDYYDCYERGLASNDDWVHIEEAITELEQLQTKLQSLEAYCEEQKDTWESQENGDHKVYEKILTKLRS